MEWVFIIAIGFICIACPILILLYLEWMPWYVSVLFAVWILASIGTITFTKSKEKKWYEKLIPTFIFTLMFTIVFMASMDTDHYMFDENTGLWGGSTSTQHSSILCNRWLVERQVVGKARSEKEGIQRGS